MSKKFLVIYEAPADFETATELADRVLLEKIDWLEPELMDTQRTWLGEESPGVRLTWKTIPTRAREAGIFVRGRFDGEPGLPDAKAARRAIAYSMHVFSDISAIVLIRDADDQIQRRDGLEQARAANPNCRIVIGLAVCERESWVLSGFVPQDADEQARLREETQKLGKSPCEYPELLTAMKDDTALRSPKRVLAALTGGDKDRERDCWRTTPLATLRSRGSKNRLLEFLEEVQVRLAPQISGSNA